MHTYGYCFPSNLNARDVAHDVDASFSNVKMTLKSVRYFTTSIKLLLFYEIAVDSQSEKSQVRILHYTSDDKRSIVLSHNVIPCIVTLNVKLCDFCKRPAGKRTNGRMSVNMLKQDILHVHEVYGLCNWLWLFIGRFKATLPHPIWIEHLTNKVIFYHFRFANAPPPLYGGNGGSYRTRGCSLQK